MTKTTARTIGGMDDKEVWKETRDKSMINEVTAYIFDTTSDKSTFQSLLAAIVLSFSDVSIAKMSSPICEKKEQETRIETKRMLKWKTHFPYVKKARAAIFFFVCSKERNKTGEEQGRNGDDDDDNVGSHRRRRRGWPTRAGGTRPFRRAGRWAAPAVASCGGGAILKKSAPFFFSFLSVSLSLSLFTQTAQLHLLAGQLFPWSVGAFFYILACFWLLLLVLLPWKWPSCTLRAFHHWLSGHRIEGYFRVCFFFFSVFMTHLRWFVIRVVLVDNSATHWADWWALFRSVFTKFPFTFQTTNRVQVTGRHITFLHKWKVTFDSEEIREPTALTRNWIANELRLRACADSLHWWNKQRNSNFQSNSTWQVRARWCNMWVELGTTR